MFGKLSSLFSRKKEKTPPAPPPPAPPPIEPNEPPVVEVEPEEVSKRVLLAEDNKINSKVAARQLQKLGYEVDTAMNGQEAVEAMKHTSYGLVLMDCQMPIMDGIEATRTIRRMETTRSLRQVPIVAMTANFSEEDRQRCKEAGMDDFMTKPVRIKVLGELLEKWVK